VLRELSQKLDKAGDEHRYHEAQMMITEILKGE
jgi:hypothetical protein